MELGEGGATEADEALEEVEQDAVGLWEVLDAGDERADVGEGLLVGADANVEAHEPHRRARDARGGGEVYHEVAGKVHGGAGGEDEPGQGDLADEPRGDADVGTDVLEEGKRVEHALVVPQRGLDLRRVDAKDVRRAGGRHDEDAREHHEPPPQHHLPR